MEGSRPIVLLHQVDTFAWGFCHVTWTCSCDARRFIGGVWVGGVMNVIWRMFAFFGQFGYYDQGSSFCLLFLSVDCECNRPFYLATVFYGASAFNGTLDQWDVATVTSLGGSKSIRIMANDLTWRELTLLCVWRVPSGVGVGGDGDDVM